MKHKIFSPTYTLSGPSRASLVSESLSSILSGQNADIAHHLKATIGVELTEQDISRRLGILYGRLGRHCAYKIITTSLSALHSYE